MKIRSKITHRKRVSLPRGAAQISAPTFAKRTPNAYLAPVAFALAIILAIVLTGCGSDQALEGDSKTKAGTEGQEWSGRLDGAGASSQETAQNAWMSTFREANPDANINYNPVGSGAGITKLAAKEVSWAGSDAPLDEDERSNVEKACGSKALHLPMYISPIAVIFKLEGVDSLQLDAPTIAEIFAGKIKTWNDPKIAKHNPDVDLPSTPITAVHRADKSGTTENFTDYLHTVAPDQWPSEADKAWPLSGGESGDKTQGVVHAVSQGNGTISYADASQVGSLGTVKLKSGDGYVEYSEESAAKAAETAEPIEGLEENDMALVVNREGGDTGAYPLILISYEIVCSKYDDKNISEGVKTYMHYLASEQGQSVAHEQAGSAPLSQAMSKKVAAAIDTIK